MFEEILENVRAKRPLIHCITNYVTANDCANMLLACGASPIMACDPEESAEITALCAGLTLNLGTLNAQIVPGMLASGRVANERCCPVLLDPVGVGASSLRMKTAGRILEEVRLYAIRGNLSEIRALLYGAENVRGVDANDSDRANGEDLNAAVRQVCLLARRTGAVVAASGAVDLVSDGQKTFCIYNGHPMMRSVTGAGCQLSALMTAFLAANPDKPLQAAAAAVCAMGLCGEIAHDRLSEQDGNASYRNYIQDAMYRLTPQALEAGARYELRQEGMEDV